MDINGNFSREDDAILARLNALKPSSVTSDRRPRVLEPRDEHATNSFQLPENLSIDKGIGLGGGHGNDEEDIETLLSELNEMSTKSRPSSGDLKDAEALMSEAQRALQQDPTQEASKDPRPEPEASNDEAESQEALNQILKQAQGGDESDTDAMASDSIDDPRPKAPESAEPPVLDSFASLQFPAVPPDSAFDSLMLPSAPTTAPSQRKQKKAAPGPAKDDDVDTWCTICCANAAVRCFGCDKDLYCWGCWREGHMGESAGMEERQHVWERYRKVNK